MITWISVAVRAGVVLTVLALGLRASFADATWLLRRPAKLGRALVTMNVITPLFAYAMVSQLALRPIVKVVLMGLAVAPIPPFMPAKAMRGGGDAGYTIGLFVVASVLAVVFVPLAVAVFGGNVSVASIASIMLVTVLAPLSIGLVIHQWAPEFAMRWAKRASVAGLAVLVVAVIPIAIFALPIATHVIGEGTLLALAAFVGGGLLVGHVLGGPRRSERTVLALTTSSRHPGVAFAVASAISTHDDKTVLATVFLYMLVCAFVSLPYSLWARIPRGGASRVARGPRGESRASARGRANARHAPCRYRWRKVVGRARPMGRFQP